MLIKFNVLQRYAIRLFTAIIATQAKVIQNPLMKNTQEKECIL